MNITVAPSIKLGRLVVANALQFLPKFSAQLVITTTQLVAATATKDKKVKTQLCLTEDLISKKRPVCM